VGDAGNGRQEEVRSPVMEGILGKKVGMTQVFGEHGAMIPVTVLEVGPCLVVQRKTADSDGYEAVQIGLVEKTNPRGVSKPMQGHFRKAGVAPTRRVAEFGVSADEEWKAGDEVKASIFSAGEIVDVVGTSKGKGFQGVVKRHGFAGGRATHGSMFHRAPGSIGASSFPSRVYPGMRAAGRMGGDRVTVKNLKVVSVDAERNVILVSGAVPGATGTYVAIKRAKKG
jgi:large subunit ribosomal protein L3